MTTTSTPGSTPETAVEVPTHLDEWLETMSKIYSSCPDWVKTPLEKAMQELPELRAENKRLREALTWYADEKVYLLALGFTDLTYDKGQRARTALEKREAE